MKTCLPSSQIVLSSVVVATCLCGLGSAPLQGATLKSSTPTVTAAATAEAEAGGAAPADHRKEQSLSLRVLEPDAATGQSPKPLPWLGLATEEASEALTAQLQLDAGVGLIVTFVAPDSPAAKAGLQKNDVLVEFDGQPLVHPVQLRKLVQVRKEGDVVKLDYCRAGKKETVSVTLAKGTDRTGLLGGEQDWRDALQLFRGFEDQFRDLNGAKFREQMKNLQRSLGDLHLDQDQVQRDIRRSVDEARKAAEDALRQATNDFKKFGPTAKILEDLARGWMGISKDATVTVNSSGSSVKTMVKADDSGTYVIVANPRKRLTAHDPSGKLLFDGEIETPEQQATVPKEIWQTVEPMVDKMGAANKGLPELESKSDQ